MFKVPLVSNRSRSRHNELTQRRMIFCRYTIFRLTKSAFFRYNENFTLGRDFYVSYVIPERSKNNWKCKVKISIGWKNNRVISLLQKIILRCVDFCFYFLHCIREADWITIDPTYTSGIIVPVVCLNVLHTCFKGVTVPISILLNHCLSLSLSKCLGFL